MSVSDENTLTIETEDLEIRLRGDEEAIGRAYEALRGVVLELEDEPDPEPATLERSDGDTQPMHEAATDRDAVGGSTGSDDDEISAALRTLDSDVDPETVGAYIQLILRRSRYHKVHLLERRDFADSFLARSLDPEHVNRMYTDTRTEERLRNRIEFGDTVWRELTEQGRAEVEGEYSAHVENHASEETSDS